MKTLALLNTENAILLSSSQMNSIRGGMTDENPDENTPKEDEAKKKDTRDYQTIDTEFDFWPEPEEE